MMMTLTLIENLITYGVIGVVSAWVFMLVVSAVGATWETIERRRAAARK